MTDIDTKIAAAIAAHESTHHLEIREGARAVEHVEVMAGKPVAGEWVDQDHIVSRRRVGHDMVAKAHASGEWFVLQIVAGGRGMKGAAADLKSAMLAADAWARANPHLLDWQMPPTSEPAPRETPAPSVSDRMAEVTAESRERAATPGGFDGEPTVAGLPAGFKYDGKSIVAAVGVVPHVTPAAPTGTCPKCGPVGLDFDDEDNHYCRKCGGAIDAAPTGTARDLAHRVAEYLAERAILLSVDDMAGVRALLSAAPPPSPAEHGEGEASCSHPIERVLPGARGWCIDCGSLFFAGAWESPLLASPAPPVPANGAEGGEVAEVLADLDAIAKRICRVVGGSASHEILDADDEALLMIRTAVEAMARDNERLRGEVAVNSDLLTSTIRLKDEHAAERDRLRARVADLERRLAVEKSSWRRVYDLDVGRLKQELAVASEARDLWMAQGQAKDRQIEAAELRVAELESRNAALDALLVDAVNAVPTSGKVQ